MIALKNLHRNLLIPDRLSGSESRKLSGNRKNRDHRSVKNFRLHGTGIAMYILGQERRLVDPPSQVVAGVRTVTTKNEWARTPPRSRPFAFYFVVVPSPLRVFPNQWRVRILPLLTHECVLQLKRIFSGENKACSDCG